MPVDMGLGDGNGRFRVYIANRPGRAPFETCQTMLPTVEGTITEIGKHCGNGWRKVFNVYAKLVFALGDAKLIGGKSSWQQYRDERLLRADSDTALLFSLPNWTESEAGSGVSAEVCFSNERHIIMGKHYALSLDLPNDLRWLDNEFAISTNANCIVCPYFDYRQLSNIKIIRLVELIKSLSTDGFQ